MFPGLWPGWAFQNRDQPTILPIMLGARSQNEFQIGLKQYSHFLESRDQLACAHKFLVLRSPGEKNERVLTPGS